MVRFMFFLLCKMICAGELKTIVFSTVLYYYLDDPKANSDILTF